VGLGRIGSLLEEDRRREKPATHTGAIRANRDCLLAGGFDVDPDRRALFARRWRVPAYGSLAELMSEARPEVLHVATPPETHVPIVEEAMKYGPRVVVCEKPLAEDAAAARALLDIERSGRCRIITNHERRYSRDYLLARRRIAGGPYGDLVTLWGRLAVGRTRSAMDMLLHDGTHMIDIVRFLVGSDLDVIDVQLSGPADKEVLIVQARAGGIPLVLEAGAGRDHLVFELDLSFERGRLRIGNGFYEEWRSSPSPYYSGMRSLARRPFVRRPRVTGYFSGMMRDAVLCARDLSRRPASSADDGVRALEFVDEVRRRLAN
jgi:predicted dehydrogenase